MTKTGRAVHIIFYNRENGYTVAVFETKDEQITIVGNFHELREQVTYELEGEFHTHPRYGEQFKVSSYREALPDDAEGIYQYLASGTVKGIGAKYARLIVEAFGPESLRVIEETPEELLNIPGIGPKKLEKIVTSYHETRAFAEVSMALGRIGLTTAQSIRLYKEYGEGAVSVVTENPYRLLDEISGMSFRKVDELAKEIGIEAENEFRVQSGILYLLRRAVHDGSTYLPKRELIEKTVELLEVGSEATEENLIQLALAGKVKEDTLEGMEVVYLYPFYEGELLVTEHLYRILTHPCEALRAEIPNLIADAEQQAEITLAEEQRRAVTEALTNKVTIITGGPGTGKTTIIRLIVRIFERLGISCSLAAPTGRAAKRMTEASGREAKTIHRLLEYAYQDDLEWPTFGRNAENPLEDKVFIIDEMSMVDILLMEAFLDAVQDDARLILVGDVDQLPSVGAGRVLADMIDSESVPVVHLREIFRQAGESAIVRNAHAVNRGEYPSEEGPESDYFFMHRKSEEEVVHTLRELCTGRLERYYDFIRTGSDIQVLTPTRKGRLGTVRLNEMLQEAVNPPEEDKKQMTFRGTIFRTGDKVMQMKNNYMISYEKTDGGSGQGIFNGDLGRILDVDPEMKTVKVLFDEQLVTYTTEELDQLELAYAVTVHKAQGCEFPAILIPMSWFPPMLMTRNLLYTALTRGKRLVVVIGSERCLRSMVDHDRSDARWSGLAARLRERDARASAEDGAVSAEEAIRRMLGETE